MKKIFVFILVFVMTVESGVLFAGIYAGPTKLVKKHINKLKEKIEDKLDDIFYASVSDPLNDYAYIGLIGKGPAEGSYPFPAIDIINAYVGTDSDYIYVKWEVAGVMPKKAILLDDGTKLSSYNFSFSLDTDRNPATGSPVDAGTEVRMFFEVQTSDNAYTIDTYYFADPTGKSHPEPERFSSDGGGSFVLGGPGHNYAVARFPLKDLGLEKGSIVDMTQGSSEAESGMWHHYSVDDIDLTLTFDIR